MNRKDHGNKDPIYLVDLHNYTSQDGKYFYYDTDPFPTIEKAVAWLRHNMPPKKYNDYIMLKKINFKNSDAWRSYPEPDVKSK